MKWRNESEEANTWIRGDDIQAVFPLDYIRCLDRYLENQRKVEFDLTQASTSSSFCNVEAGANSVTTIVEVSTKPVRMVAVNKPVNSISKYNSEKVCHLAFIQSISIKIFTKNASSTKYLQFSQWIC